MVSDKGRKDIDMEKIDRKFKILAGNLVNSKHYTAGQP